MSEVKSPGWLRALDVIFGLITIMLSMVVLAYPELAVLTLIFVLSFALLVVGIARIIIGMFGKHLSDGLRAVNLGAGILTFVLAIVALLYPQLATQTLIYLLSAALLLLGIARVVIGRFAKVFPGWLRGLLVIIGLLTIAFSVAVFMFEDFGFLTLVVMLSFVFLLNGIARIASGITGARRFELQEV